MSDVYVIGGGCTKFGELHNMSAYALLRSACLQALMDAGLSLKDIDAFYVGSVRSISSGSGFASAMGIYGKPVTRVENFCASGMDAVRQGAISIMSRRFKIVLCAGVEKLRDASRRGLGFRTSHPVFSFGATPPGLFALAAVRYMNNYKIKRETLAKVSVKNHRNGSKNPLAHLQMEVTIDNVLSAPIVAYPFGILDCSPVTDGASAVVLAAEDVAGNLGKKIVAIKGFGLAVVPSDPMYNPSFDYSGFPVTGYAAKEAYNMAGIKSVKDEITFAEVHDCFSMTEILNYEGLGIAEKGEGWKLIEEGVVEIDGKLPVNPSGGLESFGHPVGATGTRMIYEIYSQMMGRCGKRQVKDPKCAIAHNIGGAGTVSSVMVIERR